MRRFVFPFEEGDYKNRTLLGGKGAGLCEMTRIGLPVPPGFVITTEACREYYDNGRKLPDRLIEEVKENIKLLENKTGRIFGGKENPLLVSVRSGAAVSMPGMMDTILNLGLNDETVKGLMKASGDERFAYDAYRRFISMFCRIALGIDGSFDEILEKKKREEGVTYDHELSAKALKELVEEYKKVCKNFPSDVYKQLEMAIEAVFRSWESKRCVDYRREFKITPDIANGTAVNICMMVFGNMGEDSATGVAFTRDPATGENRLYGEYLPNAQGEDIVAGVRTPKPIENLKEENPKIYEELMGVREILERHYKEVQDIEFTIERGKLYILQTRNAKMTPSALVKTSVDMVKEGVLTKEEAILRIDPHGLEQLMHRRIDPNAGNVPIAMGISASPGAASGHVVFDADEAERRGRLAEKTILVREETKPDDVHGFFAAEGILTSRGGKTSHAAVVARAMGKPCVTGAENIKINTSEKIAVVGDVIIHENDLITIDGTTGAVYLGEVKTLDPELSEELFELLEWADEIRKLGVRANADTPEDALIARKFGAEGIGLCRTERMFNQPERLPIMQKMILSENVEERKKYLDQLLPMQKKDFIEILKTMEGLPVTIRLLDPPLHEFLPSVEEILRELENLR
ncbi:MAG: pyruvate, phosphate dikinase, partial [Candidatus Syntropharchaeia archaeon]